MASSWVIALSWRNLSQYPRLSTERKEMMSALRKVLVALFVLLSVGLFTAFLPLVFSGLMAFYGYQYSSASPAPALKCDHCALSDIQSNVPATAPAVRPLPFYTAIKFYMTSWGSITAGLSLSVTAVIFLTIGLIIQRLKPATRKLAHYWI
jgi:hypothetical protein